MPNYFDVFTTGDRISYQQKLFAIQNFGNLVIGYCITRDSRLLKSIEKRLLMLLDLPTWVLPAHDREQLNVSGKKIDIDLNSAKLGEELAILLFLLRPVLEADFAARLEAELFRRIIIPVEEIIAGKAPSPIWMRTVSNWNAVCTGGVVGTVLRLPMPPARRNKILNHVLETNKKFFDGFGEDCYCSEGISYFFFGFGNYMRMAMLLKQFDGRDLFKADERASRIALFPENFMISVGCFPTFADVPVDFEVNLFLMELRDILLGRRRGFSCRVPPGGNIVSTAQLDCGLAALSLQLSLFSGEAPYKAGGTPLPPLTAFPSAGTYIVRGGAETPLSAAFKGGSNSELHNHNDVGSYVVAVDGVPVVADPGKETYSARTFSDRRYESKLLNSFGHSVPRIGGELQTAMGHAGDTHAELLDEKRTGSGLLVRFDIRRPYRHVPGVEKLERSFRFDRGNGGSFTVADEAEFREPTTFEDAVVTFGEIRKLETGRFLITEKGRALLLEVESSLPFDFSVDVINEPTDHKRPVDRMTFAARGKVRQVKMSFRFSSVQIKPNPTEGGKK